MLLGISGGKWEWSQKHLVNIRFLSLGKIVSTKHDSDLLWYIWWGWSIRKVYWHESLLEENSSQGKKESGWQVWPHQNALISRGNEQLPGVNPSLDLSRNGQPHIFIGVCHVLLPTWDLSSLWKKEQSPRKSRTERWFCVFAFVNPFSELKLHANQKTQIRTLNTEGN